MTDYDNRKENQAFEHVELLQRQRESAKRAESDTKPQHCQRPKLKLMKNWQKLKLCQKIKNYHS